MNLLARQTSAKATLIAGNARPGFVPIELSRVAADPVHSSHLISPGRWGLRTQEREISAALS